MNRPEQELQRAVVEYLRLALPWAICIHYPTGGRRSKVEAAILNGLGVRAGTPDILILGAGFVAGIELKSDKGGLSKSQEEFRNECIRKSIPWAEARSLDDVERIIGEWGLVSRASLGLKRGAMRGV